MLTIIGSLNYFDKTKVLNIFKRIQQYKDRNIDKITGPFIFV